MVKLYKNGTELTNFILSTPFKDTIDIELDKLNFQIKSESVISFSKWDKITYKLQVSKNNTTYDLISKNFCLFDWVETYEGGFWLYQLTLLSPTKILDNVIINGMAETYPSTTLYAQFLRVVDKINSQLKFEQTTPSYWSSDGYSLKIVLPSTINSSNIGALASYPINDFLWDGQQTAREILQDICDKADMILIATDFTISGNKITEVKVDAIKKNKQTNKIQDEFNFKGSDINAISSVVKGITYHRDNEFNNYNIVSLTKNMICKDNKQSMYLPARNDDLAIDKADTWHILTDEPIYSLNNVKIFVPSKLSQSTYVVNAQTVATAEITLNYYYGRVEDITNYIVEKDVFDAMDVSQQSKHLYFIRGEKGIYGLFDRYKSGLTGIYSHTAIYNILHDLQTQNSYPYHLINNGEVVVDYPILRFDTSNKEWTKNLIYTIKDGAWDVNDFYNLNLINDDALNEDYAKYSLFSVNYQPYTDSVVRITNIKSNSNGELLSNIKNQSDRNIDASKYYDSQIALSKKLGQEEMTLDVMYDVDKLADYYISNEGVYKDAFYQLGDYFGSIEYEDSPHYTLVDREIEQYGVDKIKCRFTFSKNYNAKNCMINVSRDKRLYGIPLNNYVDRYIVIKKRQTTADIDKVLLESYDDFTGNTKTYGYTLLEPTKLGNATRKDYVARCKDNYACAIERTKYSSTIVNINLRYTGSLYSNDNGFKQDISVYATSNYTWNGWVQQAIADYSRLPFIPFANISSVISNMDLYPLNNVKKDKMERLIFVFIP